MNTAFTIVNRILLVILIALWATHWLCGRDLSKPNIIVFPNMVRSSAYDAQSLNLNFKNKITHQNLPEGTVPRNFTPLHYEVTEQDAVRAGKELVNPYSMEDASAVDRGSLVFRNKCVACHGPAGAGDGPVAQRGFPPPPHFNSKGTQQKKDGQLFHVITYGQGTMPGHAVLVAPEDRWKAILYIRHLQQQSGE